MRKFLASFLTFILTLSSLSLIGQIKRSDLIGDWQTRNEDSLYYKSDSIRFHMDVNHRFDDKTCLILDWRMKKGSFRLSERFLCSEQGTISSSIYKEKLLLKNRDFGQMIYLKRNGELIDQFKVLELTESQVERYPYDIKQLTVLRVDELKEQKLYNYVDSLVYNVLGYTPNTVDSTKYNQLFKKYAPEEAKIILRDSRQVNPKPLLVVNGCMIENYEFLKQFLFVEAIDIQYLTKKQVVAALYGSKAINGLEE